MPLFAPTVQAAAIELSLATLRNNNPRVLETQARRRARDRSGTIDRNLAGIGQLRLARPIRRPLEVPASPRWSEAE